MLRQCVPLRAVCFRLVCLSTIRLWMAGCAFDHSANCLSVRLFVAGLCCSLAETQREKRCQRAEEIFFPATSFHSHQINPNKMLIHVFFLLLLFFSVTVSEFWLCNRPFRLRPWGKLAYLMKSDHSLLTWGFSIHIFGGEQIFRDWVKNVGVWGCIVQWFKNHLKMLCFKVTAVLR